MHAKKFIFLLMAAIFYLFAFELDAMESKPVDSRILAAGTDLSMAPAKNDSIGRAKNGFSKGTGLWQAYASAAFGDQGKGEMYALHFGYAYYLIDYLSVSVDVLGAYIRSGIDDNGVAAGLDVTFRRHFSWVEDDPWSLFLDIGGGLQQQSTDFAGNRRFNFRILGGGGGTLRVSDRLRLMVGLRYFHASDAGIEGGGGGFDGFMLYGGPMFQF
jgi:hypothetical protein